MRSPVGLVLTEGSGANQIPSQQGTMKGATPPGFDQHSVATRELHNVAT